MSTRLPLLCHVRSLGGKFLRGHRNVSTIVPRLHPHVDSNKIAAFTRFMTQACPTRFNAEPTHQNATDYLRHGNSPSVNQHQSLVNKVFVTEYGNNSVIPLPGWTARYLEHVFLHPNSYPSTPRRTTTDCIRRPQAYPSSVAVNHMTSTLLLQSQLHRIERF